MFNKEQLKELSPFEEYFESATIGNYVRNIPGEKIGKIKEIWETASGERVREKLTCGACLLNFIKRVGQNYYKDKKEMYKRNETKKQTGGSTKRNSASTRKAQSDPGNK